MGLGEKYIGHWEYLHQKESGEFSWELVKKRKSLIPEFLSCLTLGFFFLHTLCLCHLPWSLCQRPAGLLILDSAPVHVTFSCQLDTAKITWEKSLNREAARSNCLWEIVEIVNWCGRDYHYWQHHSNCMRKPVKYEPVSKPASRVLPWNSKLLLDYCLNLLNDGQ